MLDRWIPKEKRIAGSVDPDLKSMDTTSNQHNNSSNGSTIPEIPGVDTAKGIVMTGGTIQAYMQVLGLFCKDVEERLPLLQKMPDKDTMSEFITCVHALKSASASVGAAEMSVQAARLEDAGKTGDVALISELLPGFAKQFAELAKNIQGALEQGKPEPQDLSYSPLPVSQSQLFRELAEALKSQKIPEIEHILDTMLQQAQDSKLKEILEQISDQILVADFDGALKIAEEVIDKKK